MVSWLVQRPEAALLADPGLGKTSVSLKAIQTMVKAKVVRKALVVAPLRVAQLVWTHDEGGELGRWADFQDLRVALLHGPQKEEALAVDADVYVINFDGLPWLIAEGRLAKLFKRGLDLLLVDELSRFKHPQTKRFKLFKSWVGRFKRRWGLTGSPASNGLIDLFGQLYVLDLGRALGQYITHYRHEYFLPSGFGGYTWKLQDKAEKRIYKAIKPLALSTRAADHLDLPRLLEQDLWVELPNEIRPRYDELQEDLITVLNDQRVSAANAAVASGKCRQVASGGLYVEEAVAADYKVEGAIKLPGRKTLQLHDAKTEALVDLVEELQGQPLLVLYEFHHDLERIRAALGDDAAPAIAGGSTTKDVARLVRAWNRGELPVLCGHPASMGHGLNLQGGGCAHVAWYTLTWDLELYDQAIRRVYRQGTTAARVVVHRILARKTVDETVARVITTKRQRQEKLLDALRADLRRRR
jgi:SNF2 family DNA or RNA helicase